MIKPIPIWKDLPEGPSGIKPYGHSFGFDKNHPKWTEPLVKLADYGLLTKSWYAVSDGTNSPYNRKIEGSMDNVLLRKSAANMCVKADEFVKKFGLRLLFVDGYRSPATQQGLYKFFEDNIRARNPMLTDEELRLETLVYVTPGNLEPDNPESWFVHSTGGSIDVLLYDETTSTIMDCGVGFDDDTPAVFTDFYERKLQTKEIMEDSDPLKNRRIIFNAMSKSGFTNYPYEYFHYDYGTILHSAVKNQTSHTASPLKAWYGYMPAP